MINIRIDHVMGFGGGIVSDSDVSKIILVHGASWIV